MPRKYSSVLLIMALAAAAGGASDADAQVSRRSASVLTIYSYGNSGGAQYAPEMPEWRGRNPDATGTLTDVVAVPPLAAEIPAANAPTPAQPPQDVVTPAAPVSPDMGSVPGNTAPNNDNNIPVSAPAPVDQAAATTVTIGWTPSPDSSVAGYRLYTGSTNERYETSSDLGAATTAQVTLNQSVIYVAVSAYTSQGTESLLSNRLVLSGIQDSSPPAKNPGSGVMVRPQ